MKSIFLVSQSDANRHLLEKVVQTALGDEIRLCEHRAAFDCCRANPCRRTNEFQRAGYRLHLHVNHGLSPDSLPPPDGPFLVLIEEPTIGAFARYEDDLRAHGHQHSVELLQYRLAKEAISRIDFWRKWAGAGLPNVFLARVEDLVSVPRETLKKIFSAAGVEIEDRELDTATGIAVDFPALSEVKTLEANPHFARPCFVEFMNLLAQEASYLSYAPWQETRPASGPTTTIYRARRALDDKNYEEAVSLLAAFVGTNLVENDVRAMLGRALLEVGSELEGRRALEVVLRVEPDYLDGYTLLAEHAYELGLNVEARGYLREAATRGEGVAHVGEFLHRLKVDPDLVREFPETAAASLPVERQAVIDGFRWILGRPPESEAVIDDHRRLPGDDALRTALLRSQEFMEFFERLDAVDHSSAVEQRELLLREDVIQALRWILGRSLRSRAEAEELLDSRSHDDLRLRLVGSEEFKQFYLRAP